MEAKPDDEAADDAQALVPYVRNGVLLSYPRKWDRRLLILRWLASAFLPGRDYSEAEVNSMLAGHRIDHVTLRRYLVDAQLLERAGGRYWRSAGSGEIPQELG
jgi:hypothetical protein